MPTSLFKTTIFFPPCPLFLTSRKFMPAVFREFRELDSRKTSPSLILPLQRRGRNVFRKSNSRKRNASPGLSPRHCEPRVKREAKQSIRGITSHGIASSPFDKLRAPRNDKGCHCKPSLNIFSANSRPLPMP